MDRDIEDGLRQAEAAFVGLAAMATGDLETGYLDRVCALDRLSDGLWLANLAAQDAATQGMTPA